MAFNGSGVFQRLYNWTNDKAAGIKVRADRSDAELDGFATGLSTCITKDGQTTITANLPMANFKHTGVGNATARTEYAAAGQVQDGKMNWVVAGGTVDAITASYSPAITALVDGQECCIRTTGTNTSTTPTFSPNALTARTIVKNSGTALVAGDMPLEAILRYNQANTRWELMNPIYPFVPSTAPFIDSTAIIKGSADATKLLKIEVDGITTGTTRTWTAPDSDLTIVGLATTQTLTNKSLSDSTTFIIDESDGTKKLAFQCSGITTGTTRTVTVPDKSGTMAMTSDIPTNATQYLPSNPTGTSSATQVMMGIGGNVSFTPTFTGKVKITFECDIEVSSGGSDLGTRLRYGTGTAPANAAALTGTTIGRASLVSPPNGGDPMAHCLTAIVSGLTLSTAYWFDVSLGTTGGTAAMKNICVIVEEI
jgi:hypothetical protein